MIHYLPFANETEFNLVNERFNTAFGFPSEDGLTLRYASPIGHKDSVQCLMIIQDRCLPLLETRELNSLVDMDGVKLLGFFDDSDFKPHGVRAIQAVAPVKSKLRMSTKIAAASAGAAAAGLAYAHYFAHWF